jgi:hypothetical protein
MLQNVAMPVAKVLDKAAPVLKQAGPMLGAFGAEGAANKQLNSPESIASFAKGLTSDQRLKLAKMQRPSDAAKKIRDYVLGKIRGE